MSKFKIGIYLIVLLPLCANAQVKLSLLQAVQMAKDKSLQASIKFKFVLCSTSKL